MMTDAASRPSLGRSRRPNVPTLLARVGQVAYAPTPMVPAERERPTAGMLLSVIGGVFVLIAGLFELAVGSLVAGLSLGVFGGEIIVLGALGSVFGILMIIFGVLMYHTPENHTVYGAIVLVLSIVSLFTSLGGFVIGFILGLIGGILGLTFKPRPPTAVFFPPAPAPAAPAVAQRVCLKCGRMVDPGVKFCPHCGAELPP